MLDFLTDLALPQRDKVYLLSDPAPFAAQEAAYARVRAIEGRLYDDAIVRQLPVAPAGHKHAGEWRMRLDSAARLEKYVSAKAKPLAILDLGCGNGWMTNRLAGVAGVEGLGMDTNLLELEQAARVFGQNEQLAFAYGDVFDGRIPAGVFDLIILASSLQYFAQPSSLFVRLSELLRAGGEIHILDTPFYETAAVAGARERSEAYYQSLGAPEMAKYYHHHLWLDVAAFQPVMLYDPDALRAVLRRRLLRQAPSPFPWLLIHREQAMNPMIRSRRSAPM